MSVKRFRIVLDGCVHEVEVEEIGLSGTTAAPAAVSSAAITVPAPKAPAPKAPAPKASAGAGEVTASLQGVIHSVAVTVGQQVKAGQLLLTIEAMKMEIEVVAPGNGTVATIAVKKGDSVASGDVLMTLQ